MTTRPGLTLREIAEQQHLALATVMLHRRDNADVWHSWEVGERREPGRGRPAKEYDPARVAEFYRSKAEASHQGKPGPKRDLEQQWPVDELVGWDVIGERLGVNADTLRGYPARYARGDNPFPPEVPGHRGKRRWGDVRDWDDRRRGSGRREERVIEGAVAAGRVRNRLLSLAASGLSLSYIAAATGVPERTVRRVADGELIRIRPDHAQALRDFAGGASAAPARRHIRELLAAGATVMQIARAAGVSSHTVRRIVDGSYTRIDPSQDRALLELNPDVLESPQDAPKRGGGRS